MGGEGGRWVVTSNLPVATPLARTDPNKNQIFIIFVVWVHLRSLAPGHHSGNENNVEAYNPLSDLTGPVIKPTTSRTDTTNGQVLNSCHHLTILNGNDNAEGPALFMINRPNHSMYIPSISLRKQKFQRRSRMTSSPLCSRACSSIKI